MKFFLERESSDEAGARGGQLEVLDGEWEIVIIRIVDEETVVNVLLQTFGLVASGDERTSFTSSISIALFNSGVLVEFVAVRLDFVDDHTPLTIDIDGTKWLDVSSGAWAEVSLFDEFSQSVDRIGRVDSDIFVQSQNGFVMFVQLIDNLI